MSCYGSADSFLYITCESVEQYNEVLNVIETETTLFDAYKDPEHPLQLRLEFCDPEMWSSFDHDLEQFAGMLKERFGLRLSGCLIEEVSGDRYRCEFDFNGKLQDVNIAWLMEYSVDQIKELQEYAERRFGGERSYVKLFCPRCQETRLVTANMIQLEYGHLNVVVDSKGRCELDWDTADISGAFEYVCDECGERIATTLSEVEERLKQENHE